MVLIHSMACILIFENRAQRRLMMMRDSEESWDIDNFLTYTFFVKSLVFRKFYYIQLILFIIILWSEDEEVLKYEEEIDNSSINF